MIKFNNYVFLNCLLTQKHIIMKRLVLFSTILCAFFGVISCSNDDDDPAPTPTPVITTFTATLGPPTGVTSSASGNATLKLNQTAKTFEITVTYTGLTPTAGHIHRADGGVEISFPNVATSPFTVSGAITDTQIAGLMTGTYYVNLHTTVYPDGEIKGILIKGSTSGGGGGGGGY
jgi:polyisoprenoid-binding protein YceI